MATVVKHHGALRLQIFHDRVWLCHRETGEVVEVGMLAHAPSLWFTAQGWGYIARSGDEVTWAKDILRFHLVRKSDETHVVDSTHVCPLHTCVSLDEFLAPQRIAAASLQLGHCAARSTFMIGAVLRGLHGSFLCWSLRSVWDAFAASTLMQQRFKSWRSNRWQAWLNYLGDLGLSAGHLLRAAVKGDTALATLGPGRFSFAGATTVALLALCCRWAGRSSRHGRWDLGARQSLALLDALCAKIVYGHLWPHSDTSLSDASQLIVIRRGVVENFEALLATMPRCPISLAWRQVLDADWMGSSCRISTLLVALHDERCEGACLGGLLEQVALHVEAALSNCMGGAQQPWWDSKSSLDFSCNDIVLGHKDRSSKLVHYSSRATKAVSASDVVTVVLDDSRVGRRAVKLVAAILPDNMGFWLAPQVP